MRSDHRKLMLQRLVAATALLCAVLAPADARDFKSSVVSAVDSSTVTLGDPILFSLTLSYQSDQRPDLVSPPAFDVDVDVTQLAASAVRTAEAGTLELVLNWELRFFELGDHQIAPMVVTLVSASGETESLQSAPLAVSVISVREEADGELLKDIKPPVVIPGGLPLWMVVVALTVAMAILIATLRWVFGRRRRATEAALRSPKPTDYILEFKRIARMGLVERKAFLIYYTLLSETLRRFLEDRVGVDAMERTTEEITDALQSTTVDPLQARQIGDFLFQADLVKFACAEPVAEQAVDAPEIGQRIVRAVEEAAIQKAEAAAREAEEFDDGSVVGPGIGPGGGVDAEPVVEESAGVRS